MLSSNEKNPQMQYEFVCLDQLVPEDHLLWIIQQHIDFSFIREKVRQYYCEDNGRPSIDPVVLFKMIFIGYLYGIRSERQLEKEIQTNIAYRWFLGLSLTDRVPDHTIISWNRRLALRTRLFSKKFLMRLYALRFNIEWLVDVY